MLACNDAMRRIQRLISQIAPYPVSVLIEGETGTGKELVAQAIHEQSDRKNAPFKSINCAAIPETLIESLLFGYEKGAYTGAHSKTAGVFELAENGTIFLDEVGELSEQAQSRLLRVIEAKKFSRIGGQSEVQLNARIVSATNRNLLTMVEQGRFREDLYYRLNTVVIKLPPLRDRKEDIEQIIRYLICQIQQSWNLQSLDIDEDALAMLIAYRWPGNIRQLRNAIERAAITCTDAVIHPEDLPEEIVSNAPHAPDAQAITDRQRYDTGGPSSTTGARIPDAMLRPRVAESQASFRERIQKFEIEMIKEALMRTNGKQKLAAEYLKIPMRTLTHKLKLYGITKLYR